MGPGDREFLIHPSYGAAVKTALQPTAVSEAASRTLAKKPFDWLLDEQYSNLQVSVPRALCFKGSGCQSSLKFRIFWVLSNCRNS